jgi:hypothetical protein
LSIQIHLSLEGQDLIVRCRKGEDIEEYIPSSVLADDLPRNLIEGNHHWYKEGSKCIEVRPLPQTWSRDIPKVWKATLQPYQHSLSGKVSKDLEIGSSQLVDVHSPLYQHFSRTLRSLESQLGGLLVTIDGNRPMSLPSVYVPRHDLTFFLNPASRLECQSFPGFVLDLKFQGIGTLIGLETMISLCSGEEESIQRKIIVPKGIISSQIGLYGHPLTCIELQDQGGYFAYEVDSLLGRLQGSRSVESDLFLMLLHAFTSSSLPDDLTGQSGTNEALEYLSGSSCFSMHTLSGEARSYLNTLASLTPIRSLSLSNAHMMETVKWNPFLPIFSQHPAFLPLVESILDYWRKIGVFHSLGDLLKPIKQPSGMAHLSARAVARNWAFHHQAHSREILEDSIYQPRDCMKDPESQGREMLAYQVARLCQSSTSTFPHFLSPRTNFMEWKSISAAERWSWGDISRWLPYAKSMGQIWQTLYKSCSEMVTWPPSFEVTAAFSLLGYCQAPFEFLATLAAIARRPHLVTPSPSSNQNLDLSQGEEFEQEKIKRILANYEVAYEQSQESRIQRGPNEEWLAWQARERLARQSYRESLTRDTNRVIAELRNQWPGVPGHLALSARRLLRLDQDCMQRLHSTLRSWYHNQQFLLHIQSIRTALLESYAEPREWDLYSPAADITHRSFLGSGMLTMRDLFWMGAAPSPNRATSTNQRSDRVLRPRPTDISDHLASLLVSLNEAARSELERRYVLNLSDSINAARPASETRGRLPASEALKSLVKATETSHAKELQRLKDALTPRDYTTSLQQLAGLFPVITPTALLRQISLKNRQYISGEWKGRIIEYAIRLHDAKRARRILHHYQAERIAQLSLEHHHWREWDPAHYPDWLLIEIDSNFSIRPEQASMALEMLRPVNGRNSVMQLNMGEGKSSVSISKQIRGIC